MEIMLCCQSFSRTVQDINDGWLFYPAYDVNKQPEKQTVMVPHSWNLDDVFGGMKYDRSAYVYERTIVKDSEMAGKRVFVKFDAVCAVADVAVNQKYVGQHLGGYTAFCFEITDKLIEGENKLTVVASNAYRTDVAPLAGDFNIYGGITRPVHLIVTSENCISPLDHASSGVYIHQDKVTRQQANITIETILSLNNDAADKKLRTSIIDANGQTVSQQTTNIESETVSQQMSLQNPHLWDGRKSPYRYRVKVELLQNGQVVDMVEETTGFRFLSVETASGFFLNGEHLDLHGVCRHEEAYQTGSLYNEQAMRQDAQIIEDMGATGIRFVHYPHSRFDVEQYDDRGIVVWYELSLAGPGGYSSPGYVANPKLEESLMENLEEMIKQNYNSPAICFWSLFNELSNKYDAPAPFIRRLHERTKQLDASRLTTLALCYGQDKFQDCADVIGWNKYFGWYDRSKGGVGQFMDKAISQAGGKAVGLSEYGAAGSIHQHSFAQEVSNHIHYEEYQAKVHEDNWADMAVRPQVWCKFVWQYADNPSSIRNEGDEKGMNDKGIVTYDRQTPKDTYYFYQANWSDRPMLYISARRYTQRTDAITDIKVYTNQPTVTLILNGKKIGRAKRDSLGRAMFKNVRLEEGNNAIEVTSGKLKDKCHWNFSESSKDEINSEPIKGLDGAIE